MAVQNEWPWIINLTFGAVSLGLTFHASILKDFRNAPVIFSLSLQHGCFEDVFLIIFYPLTQWTMILPKFRFANAVYSDVTLTLVFFNNCRLTAVRSVQFIIKHFELVARCLNQPINKKKFRK